MTLGNPLLIWVGEELVSLVLHKSITFYTDPAGFNITYAIFFALTTILLWCVYPELISPAGGTGEPVQLQPGIFQGCWACAKKGRWRHVAQGLCVHKQDNSLVGLASCCQSWHRSFP